MPRNGESPYNEYSTSSEFKDSINSRKSLVRGIRERSLPDREEDVDPLLGTHPVAVKRISRVGFLKTPEDADDLFHQASF